MGGVESSAGEDIPGPMRAFQRSVPGPAVKVFELHVAVHVRTSADFTKRRCLPLKPILRPAPEASTFSRASASRAHLLTEVESKQLLRLYGIPTVQTLIARTSGEAVKVAARYGSPVVLKLHSETITHKTDVGGVQLNLGMKPPCGGLVSHRDGVLPEEPAGTFQGVTVQPMVSRDGYELIVGSSIDAQFGPVLLFGSGGVIVEVYKDRSLALPPLNTTLARRMIEQTKIFAASPGTSRPEADRAGGSRSASGAL